MGNTFSDQATLVIFDSEESLVHSTETKRPEVHIPDAVVDFLKTDVFPCQGMSHAHPALFPADAAVATDEPDLEVARILDRGQPMGKSATGSSVHRSGCL